MIVIVGCTAYLVWIVSGGGGGGDGRGVLREVLVWWIRRRRSRGWYLLCLGGAVLGMLLVVLVVHASTVMMTTVVWTLPIVVNAPLATPTTATSTAAVVEWGWYRGILVRLVIRLALLLMILIAIWVRHCELYLNTRSTRSEMLKTVYFNFGIGWCFLVGLNNTSNNTRYANTKQ